MRVKSSTYANRYVFLCIFSVALLLKANATYYFYIDNIDTIGSPGIYEQGASANAISLSLSNCWNGSANPKYSTVFNYYWYNNSTNSTEDGTMLKSVVGTVELANKTTLTYTPSTSSVGTYYYYVIMTNKDTTSCGFTGTLTTETVKIRVVAPETENSFNYLSYLNKELPNGISGDLNGDGYDDIISFEESDSLRIFYNNKSGSFSSDTLVALPTGYDFDEYKSIYCDDLDNDGDLDLWNYNAENLFLLENDGKGNFTSHIQGIINNTGVQISVAKLVDINSDGYKDIVYGHGGVTDDLGLGIYNEVWINNGDLTFSYLTSFTTENAVTGVDAADIDNDGDVDIALSFNGNPTLIFENNNNNFIEGESLGASNYELSIRLLDYNFDGYADLFEYQTGEQTIIRLYENDGEGLFDTNRTMLVNLSDYNEVDFEDFNNDGFPDFILGGDFESKIYLNYGCGFEEFYNTNFGYASLGLIIGDFNNDDNQDVICLDDWVEIYTNDLTSSTQISVPYISTDTSITTCVNSECTLSASTENGTLVWWGGSELTDSLDTGTEYTTGINSKETNYFVSVIDNNGCRWNSIKITVDTSNYYTTDTLFYTATDKYISNTGDIYKRDCFFYDTLVTGECTEIIPTQLTLVFTDNYNKVRNNFSYGGSYDQLHCPRSADFDLDGDNDIMVYDNNSSLRFYANDGNGKFEDYETKFKISLFEVGDLDNDGDIDLFSNGTVYRNNGQAEFSATSQTLNKNGGSVAVSAIYDIDNDGNKDIIWLNSNSGSGDLNEIWINNGNASFTYLTGFTNEGAGQRSSLQIEDIDNDGDLDIVTGGYSEHIFVYLNDNNSFSLAQEINTYSKQVYLYDYDDDGYLDVLVYDYYNDIGVRLFLNDGSGTFSNDYETLITENNSSVAVFNDINQDGLIDIVLNNDSDSCLAYFGTNCGFERYKDVNLGTDVSEILMADFDKDNVIDAFLVGAGSESKVYIDDIRHDTTESSNITVSTDIAACGESSYTLEASSTTGDIVWYSDAGAENALASGSSYTIANLGNDTVYVQSVDSNGCTSELKTVHVYNYVVGDTLYIQHTSPYSGPSGNQSWTNDGIHYDTLTTSSGCDSVIVVSLTIGETKSDQTITFNLPSQKSYSDSSFTLSATSSSGLSVTYTSLNTDVLSISDNIATIVGVGTASIKVKQSGNDTYQTVTTRKTIEIVAADQSITLDTIPELSYPGSSYSLNATATSGLSVKYLSSNENIAYINGTQLVPRKTGTILVTAYQSGNDYYNAAEQVTQRVKISKKQQTIDFDLVDFILVDEDSVVLDAVSSVGFEINYSNSNSAVATLEDEVLKFKSVGTTLITASQDGNDYILPADDVTDTLRIVDLNVNLDTIYIDSTGLWQILDEGFEGLISKLNEETNDSLSIIKSDDTFYMTGVFSTGHHAYTLNAYDNLDTIEVSKSFTLDIPGMEISGVENHMYPNTPYTFSLKSSGSFENIKWYLDGIDQNSDSTEVDLTAKGGKHTVLFKGEIDGIVYLKSLNYNVLTINSDITFTSEQMVTNADYKVKCTTNFLSKYAFTADSVIWTIDDIRESYGITAYVNDSTTGTHALKARVYLDGYYLNQSQDDTIISLVSAPVVTIADFSVDYESNQVFDYSVTGIPSYASDVTYVVEGSNMDLTVTGSTISGTMTNEGLSNCTLDILSPEGVVIASEPFTISVYPDLSFTMPENIITATNYTCNAATSISSDDVESWLWQFNGKQNLSYSAKNPFIKFIYGGYYTGSLSLTDNDGLTTTVPIDSFWVEQTTFVDIQLGTGSDTIFQVGYENIITFEDVEQNEDLFSLSGEPEGCSIDSSDGVLTWAPSDTGIYNFYVLATDQVSEVCDTFYANIHVIDNRIKVKFQVVDEGETGISGVGITVNESYSAGTEVYSNTYNRGLYSLTTNDFGSGIDSDNDSIFYVMPGNHYTIQLSLNSESSITKSVTFSSSDAGIYTMTYNNVMVVQEITFTADTVIKTGTGSYTLTGANMNGNVSLGGTVKLSDVNLTQKRAKMKVTGTIAIDNPYDEIISNTEEKTYYLYKGLVVAGTDENSWFDLGELSSIDMYGLVMAFSENDDDLTTNDTLTFRAFPDLPWLIGDYVKSEANSYADYVLDIISDPGSFPMITTFNTSKLNAGELDEAVKYQFTFPDIDITKCYIGESRTAWDWSMDGLSLVTPYLVSLEELSVEYRESDNYFRAALEISWDLSKRSTRSTADSTSSADSTLSVESIASADSTFLADSLSLADSTMTPEELVEFIRSNAGGDSLLANVPINIVDLNNNLIYTTKEKETRSTSSYSSSSETLYHTQYDDFDNLENVKERQGTTLDRGIALTGLGFSFGIRSGVIDELTITVGITIPIPSLGISITKVSGGVTDLSTVNSTTGEVSYNDNFSMYLNCTVTDLAATGIIALEDAGVTVKSWNYFEASGVLTMLGYEIGSASMSYDANKELFSASLPMSPICNFMSGTTEFSIGNDSDGEFDITGAATVDVVIPTSSIIPVLFQDIKVGSVSAGINTHRVAASVTMSLTSDSRSASSRWGWSSFCSWVEDTWNDVVEVVETVVTYTVEFGESVVELTEELLSYLDVSIGIGYDFDNDKFLWGTDVEVPSVSRYAYRGDTLEYAFTLTEDTRKAYIIIEGEDEKEVSYNVYNPNNELVNSEIGKYYIADKNTSLAVLSLPELGTWTVKIDTVEYGSVDITTMYKNNTPTGMFTSPVSDVESTAEVALRFNDIDDTLDVAVYLDDDKEDFNGFQISKLKVLNNATVKFTYSPEGLEPGSYYFYYILSDGSGIPIMKYSTGALVISAGDVEAPANLQYTFTGDSLIIHWDAVGDSVLYTRTILTNEYRGTSVRLDMAESDSAVFTGLIRGDEYQVECYNVNTEGEYSSTTILSDVVVEAEKGKNTPKMDNYQDKYEFREGSYSGFPIEVSDLDGDEVSYSIIENMPKTMELQNDSLVWCPQIGDAGSYDFHLVLTDGTNSDTLELNMSVKNCAAKSVDLQFASRELYESDNMFVTVHDESKDDATLHVVLMNGSTGDTVGVTGYNVGGNDFIAYFQVSETRRSALSVSDGDSIVAVYGSGTTAYLNYAIYNATPQITDNVPPSAITDLKAYDYNRDSVMLVFTVPADTRDDDATEYDPWVYDVRYSYSDITSEETYVASLNFEKYDVKESGSIDTVYLKKDLIDSYDVNSAIWFDIKVGDSKFNYSEISNSSYITQVVSADDVEAEFTSAKIINVDWNGPVYNEEIEGFEYYNLYRSIGSGSMEKVASLTDKSYNDTITTDFSNGKVKYAVVAVYSDQVTDSVYSNTLIINLFHDLTIQLMDSDNTSAVLSNYAVDVTAVDHSVNLEEAVTDGFGVAYFNKTMDGTYNVVISISDETLISDEISLSKDSTLFTYDLNDYRENSDSTDTDDSTEISLISSDIVVSDVSVYPNPSSTGQINLEVLNSSLQIEQISIFSVIGQSEVQFDIEHSGSNYFISLGEKSKGIYIMKVNTNDGYRIIRLIID